MGETSLGGGGGGGGGTVHTMTKRSLPTTASTNVQQCSRFKVQVVRFINKTL